MEWILIDIYNYNTLGTGISHDFYCTFSPFLTKEFFPSFFLATWTTTYYFIRRLVLYVYFVYIAVLKYQKVKNFERSDMTSKFFLSQFINWIFIIQLGILPSHSFMKYHQQCTIFFLFFSLYSLWFCVFLVRTQFTIMIYFVNHKWRRK